MLGIIPSARIIAMNMSKNEKSKQIQIVISGRRGN